MSLLPILISGIGSGIAKGILNIWLNDEPFTNGTGKKFTNEIGKNFISIIASKAEKDIIAQRKGIRQFEIANNLLPLFEPDGTITEAEQKEVAQFAGIAIEHLQISADQRSRIKDAIKENLKFADNQEEYFQTLE